MISKDKTAYPTFYSSYTDKELNSLFKPTNHESDFIEQFSPKKKVQLVMLIFLKTHQYLGYFPELESIPTPILNFFKTSQRFSLNIDLNYSSRYLRKIKASTLEYLKIKTFSDDNLDFSSFLKERACTMADPTDLINAGITELLRNHYSLPSFEVLERFVLSSRHQAHQEIYQNIERRLSDNEKEILQQLLFVKEEEFITPFTKIKSHPNTAKFSHIQEWKDRFIWLKSLLDTSHILKDIYM